MDNVHVRPCVECGKAYEVSYKDSKKPVFCNAACRDLYFKNSQTEEGAYPQQNLDECWH